MAMKGAREHAENMRNIHLPQPTQLGQGRNRLGNT